MRYKKTYHECALNEPLNIDFHVHKGPFKNEHTHEYFEIMIVTDSSVCNIVNGSKTVLSKGDIQIIRPDDKHSIIANGESVHTHINIEINTKVFKDVISAVCEEEFYNNIVYSEKLSPFKCDETDILYFEKLLHRIKLCGDNIDKWEKYLRQILAKVILLAVDRKNILFQYNQTDDEEREYKIVKQTLSLMKKKENFCLKIPEFCKILKISEKHLGRVFEKAGKDTPGKEFKNIKYDYAAAMFLTTNATVLSVMEEIGVWDVGHFNRIFKEKYGMTPGAFRDKNREH